MPPPASFITITVIPFTQVVTQAMFNVANVQWFKYVAAVPIVLGIQTNSGGTFTPFTSVFHSDGTTLIEHDLSGVLGHWHALPAAGDYYVKVERPGTGPSDFDFTFTADTKPLDVISLAAGDLIVNDDSNNYPAVVLDSTGTLKFFVSAVPGGETGAILPSNVSFWHDFFGRLSAANRIAVFDENLAYVTSVACGLTGSNKPRFGTDVTNNQVYVVNQSRQLWTISAAGVAANTGYTFAALLPFPDVMAVNEDGTQLYWATIYGQAGIIHTVNLITLTDLPDLHTIAGFVDGTDSVAVTPNTQPGDMFVMPNGNVVTWWATEDPLVYHLIVVSSSGTLLHSYDYAYPAANLDHLAYINGDSDHILAWWYTDEFFDVGRFGRITLATGVIDQDFTQPMFSQGVNFTGTEKFGPSNSCTFVRRQTLITPAPDCPGFPVDTVTPGGSCRVGLQP